LVREKKKKLLLTKLDCLKHFYGREFFFFGLRWTSIFRETPHMVHGIVMIIINENALFMFHALEPQSDHAHNL
jgi:hypothetical protein